MTNILDLSQRFLLEKQSPATATVSNVKRIVAFFRDMEPKQIRPDKVMDYVITRRAFGAKPSTINRELSIMKQFFKWMWKRSLIDTDPTLDIKNERGVVKRIRYLSLQEEEKLLSSSKGWLCNIIIFAVSTGMRRGEILSLTKDKIDLDRRVATVEKSKNGTPRVVPLTSRAMQVVEEAMRSGGTSEFVFTKQNGKRVLPVTLKHNFRRAAKIAGLTDIHFHDLRHTFATRLVQGGVDLYAVQLLLGHTSPIMTQRYSHHSVESLRSVMSS